ncbi:MAG: nitrilase-related carbon-nitrogen hydrolase, partial [Paraburkholderia nemoris]
MSETHVSSSSSAASSTASPTAASGGSPESAFRVAALQMVSTPDRERNLAEAERLIAEAAADGAQLVLLPEYFCFMGFKDTDKLAVREAYQDGPIQRFLADAARRHK